MKKITLSVKNLWNTPVSKVLTITAPIAGLVITYFAPAINTATIGGATLIALLGLLAGQKPEVK
jgi:hypothetical protein